MSKVINEMEKARVPRAEIIKYLRYIDDPMERRNLEAKFENYQFWHVSNIIHIMYYIISWLMFLTTYFCHTDCILIFFCDIKNTKFGLTIATK